MNKNVRVRTINNISYNITRVFSERPSIEDIIIKLAKDELNASKSKNKAFTDRKTHDIINYE